LWFGCIPLMRTEKSEVSHGAARPQPACAGGLGGLGRRVSTARSCAASAGLRRRAARPGRAPPSGMPCTAWISCICLGSKYARMTRRKLCLCRVAPRSRNFTRLRPEIVVDEIAGGAPIPDPLRCRPCRLGFRNRRERDGLGSQPLPNPEEGLGGGCGAVWMNCKDYGICKGLVSKNASNNIMSNLPSISSCRNRNIASINFRMELVFERRALRRICRVRQLIQQLTDLWGIPLKWSSERCEVLVQPFQGSGHV